MKRRPGRLPAALRPVLFLALLCGAFLLAGGTAKAELTPEQESLARTIDGKLIAPCCWTQTVAEHQSEIADQMKAQTRTMIAQGTSEGEIIDGYVTQYGESILASPRARGFNLLAYVLPILAIAAAGAAGTMWLRGRRRTRASEPGPAVVAGETSARDAEQTSVSPLRSRMEHELSQFDA